MLHTSFLSLAAASLLSGIAAASPHQHQYLHQKRAMVTTVETVTDYVTVFEDAAPASFFENRKKSTKTRTMTVTTVVPMSTPSSAAPSSSLQILKESSAAVAAEAVTLPAVPTVPVAVPTVAVPAPIAPAPAAPAGGALRGLAYDYNSKAEASKFIQPGNKISWRYDWGQDPFDVASSVPFIPMLWSATPDRTATWMANAKKAIAAGADAVLSFNEADLSSQANMSPAVAAQNHKTYMNPLKSLGVQVGSPAITSSSSPGMGISWLKQFYTECAAIGGCITDFVACHVYQMQPAELLQHLIDVSKAAGGLPVWLTEFAFDGSDDQINSQMNDFLHQIETNATFSFVHRIAYFYAAEGQMVKGSTVTSFGNTFAYNG